MKGSMSGQLGMGSKEVVSKFSSWGGTSSIKATVEKQQAYVPIVDAVDELLIFEHDGSQGTSSNEKNSSSGGSGGLHQSKPQIGVPIQSKKVQGLQQFKTSLKDLMSPTSSIEYDSFDLLEDEMLKGFPLSKQEQKYPARISPAKQRPHPPVFNEDLHVTDPLDFENSQEDLNKIIQRYETMLGGPGSNEATAQGMPTSKQIASLKQKLEESWGSHERLKDEIAKHSIEEDYDEDDFEKTEDFEDEEKAYKKESGYEDDEDKLVDEEINLSSSYESNSGGKKDSDFLKELMKPPIRTKFSSQCKAVVPTTLEGDGSGGEEYTDEIDDFIKKHIETEEREKAESAAKQNEKRFQSAAAAASKSDSSGDSGEEEDSGGHEDEDDSDKKSPKEHMIDCLDKLSDSTSKYSLTDR